MCQDCRKVTEILIRGLLQIVSQLKELKKKW